MRRIFALSILFAALFCTCGCDFVRKVAGRPTSSEIEAKRAVILSAQRDTATAAMDTVAVVDTTAVVDTVAENTGVEVRDWSDLIDGDLPCAYYVLIGVFSNRDNAANQAAYARHLGYAPTLIHFTNGRVGVGVCGGDYGETALMLEEVLGEPFCPRDAFILKTR